MNSYFPNLFSPISVGTHTLKNRAVLTPHAHVVSSLWASEEEARGHIAYWRSRSEAAWVDGVSAHVRNRLPSGFDPTGVGAQIDGHFRQPYFRDRVGELAETLHGNGTVLTVQMILQGGMPNAPAAILSGPTDHNVPHPMTVDDIKYFIDEYAYSAARAVEAGADGVELHLNHDDILEWFVSPLTNRRMDAFGGSQSKRVEFPRLILAAIRDAIGSDSLLGIRFNMREDEPGGYSLGEGAEILRELLAGSELNWVSLTAGTPWGNPSYVQSQHHRPAEWAPLSSQIRAMTDLPLVYTGRVTSPEVAEKVLRDGHADLVGFARAMIADGELLLKAKQGRADDIRPCVAGNECISRRLVENTPFSCAVNPVAGREHLVLEQIAVERRSVLVVGAGPAGMELAATLADRGHSVELWEANRSMGGQLNTAAKAPRHEDYNEYLAWQRRRLEGSSVKVQLGMTATVDDVISHNADTVFLTTGASARLPDISGIEHPGVLTSVAVLDGVEEAPTGPLLVIAEDDHLPPLAVADHLAQDPDRDITIVFQTPRPAPDISRYSVGSALGRLYERDVKIVTDTAVSNINSIGTNLEVIGRNVYTQKEKPLGKYNGIVLSCGSVPNNDLQEALMQQHEDVRTIGDAWAPRRLVWATRQAYEAAMSV